jgi:hypothetical protein
MNRRDFLKVGLTCGVVAGFNSNVIAASLDAAALRQPDLVIADNRFEASQRFGSEAARNGLPLHVIDGDITALWFETLDPQWRRHPTIIAGMTAPQPLFCLERLAHDRGMRVVLRITHEALPNNQLSHQIETTEHLLQPLSQLLEGPDWSERMARLAGVCSWRGTPGSCSSHRIISGTADASLLVSPLVSWVIAPLIS